MGDRVPDPIAKVLDHARRERAGRMRRKTRSGHLRVLTHEEQIALVEEARAARICFRGAGQDTEERQ
jgi:hypothetical protein